jgi:hypothetical protein
MPVYTFNPLEDPRWAGFGTRHPHFSVFHTTGWLEALNRTYGYEPIVYSTSPAGATLTSGIVFCRISSWLTGRRLVSLPFADHCEPLLANVDEGREIFNSLQSALDREKFKYIEIRPLCAIEENHPQLENGSSFCFHSLDLRPSLADLFRSFQKDSTQRKIRRAEREGLGYEAGRSQRLLNDFYRLSLLTRRRHGIPPQPVEWFQNLIACMRDRLTIHMAFNDDRAIAGILTLRHGHTLVYKYGCSDANFHKLGGMPFLFWKAIQEAKEHDLWEFDLGRSDCDNAGLIAFKEHLGATRATLVYKRWTARNQSSLNEGYGMKFAKRVMGHLPGTLLTTAGKLLYRHVG